MKLILASVVLLLAAGCAYHPVVTAYGANGKQYTAPSLCAALLACKAAGETSCYYDADLVQDQNGKYTVVESCREIKK